MTNKSADNLLISTVVITGRFYDPMHVAIMTRIRSQVDYLFISEMSKEKESTALVQDCQRSTKLESWSVGEWELWLEERKVEADDTIAKMSAATYDSNLKKGRSREILGVSRLLTKSAEVLREVKALKSQTEGQVKLEIKKTLPKVRKLVKETQDLHR